MGKSRSRNRTRGSPSNPRLRSSPSRGYQPKPVGYAKLGTTRAPRVRQAPSLQTKSNVRPYRPRGPIRVRVPTNVARPFRPYTPSGVWVQGAPSVADSSRPDKELSPSMVCVRRSTRREVLHATNQTGKSGQKSPVYNRFSKIRCKSSK